MMRLPSCLLLVLALSRVGVVAEDAEQRAKDAVIVRTLMRLPGIDLSSKPDAKAALLRHLATIRGSEQYLELVECALLLPVRIRPREAQTYRSTYLIRSDLPAETKTVNVLYEFNIEDP